MQLWQPAYVGIGSNLEDPQRQVRVAVTALGAIAGTRFITSSPFFGSKPLDATEQPDFVNAVAGLLTQLTPEALLAQLKAIEKRMGRPDVHARWAPRVIDLDLLMQGGEQRATPGFTLPHAGIVERNFVLYPLAAIAPDLEVPGLGTVRTLTQRIGAAGLWPL